MPKQTNILKALEDITKEQTRTIEERFDRKLINFKDEILTGQDKMNKKLDKILTEHPVMNASIDQNRDKVENHETRIHHLEEKPAAA